MNILAVETSTESCSVALLCGDALIERSMLAARHHAEHVLPMAEAVLAEAGLARSALDGIAAGRGPGAFTGVRLAISVAQGLAFGLERPVVTVSSLAALAMEAPASEADTLAVIDARMGEIYAGTFGRTHAGLVEALGEECVCKAEDLPMLAPASWQVVGSGWGTYASALHARLPSAPTWAQSGHYPQARHVARLALPEFSAGRTLTPEQALPVYLRDKVAQTLRERGKPVPHLP